MAHNINTKIDIDSMADAVESKVKEEINKLNKLNIMVLGKTGVGKSTLINSIFGSDITQVGIGKPVTDSIEIYDVPDSPLVIYDTPGLELSGENSREMLINGVTKIITDGYMTGNPDNLIHCILYCVSTSSHRFENSEKEFISRFLDVTMKYRVPVIMVLTQAFNRNDAYELKKAIKNEGLDVIDIIPVLAQDVRINEEYTVSAYGLDILVDTLMNIIPEKVKESLATVQMIDIRLKQKKAGDIVKTSAAAAAGIAAVPIPFSDAVTLIPEINFMLSSVTVVFGIPADRDMIKSFIESTIGANDSSVVKKIVQSGLYKFIPGLGIFSGSLLSSGYVHAVVFSLGTVYINVMTKIADGEMTLEDLNSRKTQKHITQTFKDLVKIYDKSKKINGSK